MEPTNDPLYPSPRDGVPSHSPPVRAASGGGPPVALLAAAGAVTALVIAAVVVVVSAGGDGGDPEVDVSAVAGVFATTETLPSNAGTVAPTTATTEADGESGGGRGECSEEVGADLPGVTIPAEASPPTTVPDSDLPGWPIGFGDGEELPGLGEHVIDLDEGGYEDVAVHLRSDQRVAVISAADDDRMTQIEAFAPDGASEGCWVGGEPDVVNGLEWVSEPLPATGTYVFRVIHTGGSHEPFLLRFFGDP